MPTYRHLQLNTQSIMPSGSSRHGTLSRYRRGCHCDLCRAANTEYARRRREGQYATKSEVKEWMRGLGWDRPMPANIPQPIIDRWNREHPDRPYIGGATPPTPTEEQD